MGKRKAFTLIEVIIALGIFMIVLLALVDNYYSYYRNVQYQRFKTIGENLAQLQLEDIQNLPTSVLKIMVGELSEPENGDEYLGEYLPNYPKDTAPDKDLYDSGFIDGEFFINNLTTVPDPSDRILPDYIDIKPKTGIGPYSLTLYKEAYPNYQKRIIIKDLTPKVISDANKIFKIQVEIKWTINNKENSVTITGLKSDIRTQ